MKIFVGSQIPPITLSGTFSASTISKAGKHTLGRNSFWSVLVNICWVNEEDSFADFNAKEFVPITAVRMQQMKELWTMC